MSTTADLILLAIFSTVSSVNLTPIQKCGPVLIDPGYFLHKPLICNHATPEDLPQTLQFDYEEITFINSTVPIVKKEFFQNFPHLVNFNAINSSVEEIEDDAFKNKSMRWINLSLNKLKRINPNLFQDSLDFYRLDLSNNTELVIPVNESFLNAPQLKWLVLSGCNIQNLTSLTFKNLSGLNLLTLSKNNIEFLPDCVFGSLRHLEYLDLSYNKLKRVSVSVFNNIEPRRLYLAGNPWLCDCDLYPAIKWSKSIKKLDEISCAGINALTWQNITLNCPESIAESRSSGYTLHLIGDNCF